MRLAPIAKITFFLALLAAPFHGHAADSTPATRADQTYQDTRRQYEAHPANTLAAWQFARACFDQAEFARNNTDRATVANQGIAACRRALATDPNLAPAHYYLGMDLAQLARTELLGALSLLSQIEQEWQQALKLDEKFDFAGPDRNLGTLYLNAPNWPLSIGSRAQSRQHFLRALQLAPNYPENHLNLIDACLKWNDAAEARAAAKKFEQMLPAARQKFTGPFWESYWDDWNKRWQDLQNKLNRPPDHSTPHGRK